MSKPKITPLNNFVLGLQEKSTKRTKSGFILPESSEKRLAFTKVIAIGPSVERVKVGERILFKEFSEFQFSIEGEDYVCVEEADVLAEVKQ